MRPEEEYTRPNRLEHTSRMTRANRALRRGPAYPKAPSQRPVRPARAIYSQWLYRLYLFCGLFAIGALVLATVQLGSQISIRFEEQAETTVLTLPEELIDPEAAPIVNSAEGGGVTEPDRPDQEEETAVAISEVEGHTEDAQAKKLTQDGEDIPLIVASELEAPTVEAISPIDPMADSPIEEEEVAADIALAEAEPEVVEAMAEPAAPVRLIIPDIEVDHEIIQVPIVRGRWDVSDLGQQVGQLEGTGRYPGDEMSMTLVAHATTNWPVWGPFQRLNHLPLGATIEVETETERHRYAIVRFVYVDPTSANAAFQANGNQLILITCGNYDFVRGEYQERLVAYAELLSTESLS